MKLPGNLSNCSSRHVRLKLINSNERVKHEIRRIVHSVFVNKLKEDNTKEISHMKENLNKPQFFDLTTT